MTALVASGADAASWDRAALDAAQATADELGTHSYLLVDTGGCVIDRFGDLDEKLQVFSIRKSFVSALYGVLLNELELDLDTTLAELGVDDKLGLTTAERRATVRHLLMSVSGVYHPAAYETPGIEANRPERGAHAPGEHHFYNNWDFNVAAALLERATGERLGDLFAARIARPTGMTGFEPFDVHHIHSALSDYPAPEFWMDARDQARFGLLYLHRGRVGERQLIPEEWIEESTTPHSDLGMFGGYGYSWWVALRGEHFPLLRFPDGTISARGTGEQLIFVLPHVDAVWVHRTRVTRPDQKMMHVTDAARLLQRILAAHRPDEPAVECAERLSGEPGGG